MMSAFWLCQRWVQRSEEAEILQDASLMGFVRLGGQFGFEGPLETAEGGMLSGFLKAIAIELWVAGYRGLPVKIWIPLLLPRKRMF